MDTEGKSEIPLFYSRAVGGHNRTEGPQTSLNAINTVRWFDLIRRIDIRATQIVKF